MIVLASEEGIEALLARLTGLLAAARAKRVDPARLALAALAGAAAAAPGRAAPAEAAEALGLVADLALAKSRALLPAPPSPPPEMAIGAETSPELRERRLGMRAAAAALEARPRLHRDVFPRGAGTAGGVSGPPPLDAAALALAYAALRLRALRRAPVARRRVLALSLGRALAVVRGVEGLEEWRDWRALLRPLRDAPETGAAGARSLSAAGFAAALELARAGRLELRQDAAFGPISVRRRPPPVAAIGRREAPGDGG